MGQERHWAEVVRTWDEKKPETIGSTLPSLPRFRFPGSGRESSPSNTLGTRGTETGSPERLVAWRRLAAQGPMGQEEHWAEVVRTWDKERAGGNDFVEASVKGGGTKNNPAPQEASLVSMIRARRPNSRDRIALTPRHLYLYDFLLDFLVCSWVCYATVDIRAPDWALVQQRGPSVKVKVKPISEFTRPSEYEEGIKSKQYAMPDHSSGRDH
ncbi:hypothetical protein H4582DRAFT_2062291 [Lactarius indigo]|nr:hypothetical protein H4582DRAFT_2062291 [Lactarius indigo]